MFCGWQSHESMSEQLAHLSPEPYKRVFNLKILVLPYLLMDGPKGETKAGLGESGKQKQREMEARA